MKQVIFFAKHMEIGGLEKSLVNLLNRLDHSEYQVYLVLEERHGPLLEQLDPRIQVSEYRLSACPFVPLRKLLNFAKRSLWTLKHRNQYAFSCSYCTYSIIGSRLAQIASPNSCLYVHNDYTTIYPDPQEFRDFFAQLRTDRFQTVLFVSNESRERFVGRLPELEGTCQVLNNLVDGDTVCRLAAEPCVVHKQPGESLFVFVGRLSEPHKRMSRLLEAFRIAREQRKDIRLLMVGDGPDRSLCEEYIAQWGLEDCVELVGAQTNPYQYLEQGDCLVLSSDYEGFPVVYFEAMILGKDIITTIPVSDERIRVSDYGTIVEKDPRALAQALISYHPHANPKLDMEALNQQRIAKLNEIIRGDHGNNTN